MLAILLVIGIIVVLLGSGYACQVIARKHGMSSSLWMAMGLTFGPFGLLLALFASLFSKQ